MTNDYQLYKIEKLPQEIVAKAGVTDSYLQGTANAATNVIQNTKEFRGKPLEKDKVKCLLKDRSRNDKVEEKMVVMATPLEGILYTSVQVSVISFKE